MNVVAKLKEAVVAATYMNTAAIEEESTSRWKELERDLMVNVMRVGTEEEIHKITQAYDDMDALARIHAEARRRSLYLAWMAGLQAFALSVAMLAPFPEDLRPARWVLAGVAAISVALCALCAAAAHNLGRAMAQCEERKRTACRIVVDLRWRLEERSGR